MNLISFALIISGVLLNATAQLLLKAGTNSIGHFEFHADNIVPIGMKLAFQPHILSGMACYAISLVVWIMALSRVPVSIAYPMLSLSYVLVYIGAVLWPRIGESASFERTCGILLVVAGVVLINLKPSSRRGES